MTANPLIALYKRDTEDLIIFFSHYSISLLASSDFCHLLITFENSLDPDQDPHNVGPDLDPNCLKF